MSPPPSKLRKTAQPTYMIGHGRPPKPLVTVEQVQDHLQLLSAFHRLQATVEDGRDNRIPRSAMRMDRDSRWRWFIHLAINRFEKWVEALYFSPGQFLAKYHPPLDTRFHSSVSIAMEKLAAVWTSYLKDTTTNANLVRDGSVSRAESWYQLTGTLFDPFDAMTRPTYKQLQCPRCRTRVYVPFLSDNNTGYAENFVARCPLPSCRMRITHEALAVAKFVWDLNGKSTRHEHYIAGSLINSSGKRDHRRARLIKDQLIQTLQYSNRVPLALDGRLAKLRGSSEFTEAIGYSLKRLREAILATLRNYPASTSSRIISAYSDGGPFSVDLLDAVLRQSIFTEKMDELGWIRPELYQGERYQMLDHAILRYHAFLDLTASRPSAMFVPTLDIDLVWHTHQLMASRYGSDCELYVGRYLDHPLKVPEDSLSLALDETCLAWQLRYQVPYMQCGCALPDETSWQKCMRLVRQHLRGRTYLQVPLPPDLIPATHPSIHNAILT
ncbi:hypothetical protein ID866_10667, partial [Astraeus odoratus]